MARANLLVTLPEHVWIQQVSTTHPEATVEVIAAVPGRDAGFALVRITAPEIDPILQQMRDHPQLSQVTVAQRSQNTVTVHFESSAPLLLFSSKEAGVPIEFPVEIQDGQATITVTGSRDQLSGFADHLERFDLAYEIEHIGQWIHDSQLLSDRQRELLLAAVEGGYYDTPRGCTLTDLAERLGIAKSTCSETLHRAEEAIIKEYVADLPQAGQTETRGRLLTSPD